MNKENLPENPEMNQENPVPPEEITEAAEPAEAEEAAASVEEPPVEDGLQEEQTAEDDAVGEEAGEEEPVPAADKKGKKKRSRADTRKFRFGAMATGLTVVVIAAVVLLNVVVGILADRFPLNLDLTKDKTYSLQDKSVEVIKNVKKDVEIVIFAEEELFSSGNASQYQELNTILRQYHEALVRSQSLSGGKIKLTYVDTTDPTWKTKYSAYSPSVYDTLLLCGDRYQKIGLNDLYTTDQSSYTVISKAEQALISKLTAVTSDANLVLTIFTGHEEDSTVISGLSSLYGGNGYTVEQLNLATAAEFNENSTLGIVAAPAKDFTEEEIKRLREWMSNDGQLGRNLMVVVNYSADCPNLYGYLKDNYQLEVTDNLILETDPNKIMGYSMYYSYVDIQETDVTKGLGGMTTVLGPTRQLLTTNTNTDTSSGSTVIPLLTYGDTARLAAVKDVTGDATGDEEKDPTFKADAYPINGALWARNWTYNDDNEVIESNILLMGSMFMATSQGIQTAAYNNEEVLLSTVNKVVGNEDAVNISTKIVGGESLSYTKTTINIILVVFVVAVPAAILAVCLVVFLRRRHL